MLPHRLLQANQIIVGAPGNLFSWGSNSSGALGLGAGITTESSPALIGPGWYHTALVEGASLGLKTDGTLWSWGNNNRGQLGLNVVSTTKQQTPSQVGTFAWRALSGGKYHALGIRADGTLWAWGGNQIFAGTSAPYASGQLGDSTTVTKSSPVQIGANAWLSVAGAIYSSAAVRSDGTLWTWGYGKNGTLGSNAVANRSSPAQVGTATTWVSVAGGDYVFAAINSSNQLFTWGLGTSGQLGNGLAVTRSSPVLVALGTWSKVSVGRIHMLGIQTDGSLWAWGAATKGQLGTNAAANKSSPVLLNNASVWVDIAAGNYLSAAINASGQLFTWGYGPSGQLGIGVSGTFSSPVQVPGSNWKNIQMAAITIGPSTTVTSGRQVS